MRRFFNWDAFLPTPSARRATVKTCRERSVEVDFYPRPPRGGRPSTLTRMIGATLFLPTPSARRATWPARPRWTAGPDFYPRPPRGGRPPSPRSASQSSNFYPRPPRGGRLYKTILVVVLVDFYPRPPRGGRLPLTDLTTGYTRFLPTPSARRATFQQGFSFFGGDISTHALREEGDRPTGQYLC